MTPVLVDTSVWIEYFRGRNEICPELDRLLDDEVVLLPIPVWIELLSGASKKDLALLRNVLSALPRVWPTKNTWKMMETWISLSSKRGKRFGLGDLLIAALCSEAGAKLWSIDHDFIEMSKLKFLNLY